MAFFLRRRRAQSNGQYPPGVFGSYSPIGIYIQVQVFRKLSYLHFEGGKGVLRRNLSIPIVVGF